ncbi:protein RMD9, mitochondrial [Metschnikowia bicuspidata var. bicuspidata NRRL YB-4993]|uniref:Protein RMD9, mitochondrial n=1 Tax=Metschnikowia bicuspidata var. bicuspidata NRRL YB-4993 TaxID=869754 RepID=A0A1A0HFJ5_9ASCO|nr:protein RMD9, mitochondrial [Metschnikowia bicuspidata var. bicuspidata NRRL YB-4993]OBA22771.1 protein RMD9, mitochondrial [Metschnikowia bicuspidata var. bicuspidata NRRL YB-4993]
MFRLLAHNTGSTLRPVLLRNVRPNTTFKKSGPANAAVDLDKSFQFRSNLSSATVQAPATKPENKFSKSADPLFAVDKLEAPSGRGLAARFEELLQGATGKTILNRQSGKGSHMHAVRTLVNMFRDDAVRGLLSSDDIYDYTNLLNEAVYANRFSRLSDSRNRDSDQYHNVTLSNDIWLKNAVLELADTLSDGPMQQVLTHQTLRKLLFAMLQLKVHSEMIRFWEHGVNDPVHSSKYLQQTVLAVILPLTYAEKRFLYDQVIKLFEVNTNNVAYVTHNLLGAVGKVAIQEGDYLRALDCLEQVLAYLEKDKNQLSGVNRTLAELHAAFIGDCKDIKIARHFFTKCVENQLPYHVTLKAPHVQKLMENCVAAEEPFETILDFWKQTLTVYATEPRSSFNARYSIINKAFFSIFFRMYPTLSEEGYNKLKEVIAIYASIKPMDDFFLNNIVSNCTWNDKTVFTQIVENYAAHNVTQTPVLYRVILKKMGEIEDFSSAEILRQWDASLHALDAAGFSYIPIADWASLREATILSHYSESRSELYLALLHAYRNYHQDDKAVHRFVKYWMSKLQAQEITRVTETAPAFNTDVEISVPEFTNLRENVDYDTVASNIAVASREDNDARSEAFTEL